MLALLPTKCKCAEFGKVKIWKKGSNCSTRGHPLQRLNEQRRALWLLKSVEWVATFSFLPLEASLTLARDMANDIVLQCNDSAAFSAAVGSSLLISLEGSLRRVGLHRQTRVSSEYGTIYFLSLFIRMT